MSLSCSSIVFPTIVSCSCSRDDRLRPSTDFGLAAEISSFGSFSQYKTLRTRFSPVQRGDMGD